MKNFTVTVERAEVDRYGTPSTPTSKHTIKRCNDWPGTSTERAGSWVQTTTTRVLLCPAGADIRENDTVIYPSGVRWHVIGEPYDWDNIHARHRPGVQVNLEKAH